MPAAGPQGAPPLVPVYAQPTPPPLGAFGGRTPTDVFGAATPVVEASGGFTIGGETPETRYEMVSELVKMTPIKREGAAEDVAAAVGFLCSERAGFITGQVLAVDGGLSL